MTREQQILTLLTERCGEKLTGAEVAKALHTDIFCVRAALKRLWVKGEIRRYSEPHRYTVANSVCHHVRFRWFCPPGKAA